MLILRFENSLIPLINKPTRHTGIPGLWTKVLNAGRWTLDAGLLTLDAGPWTLDSRRWTLDATLWTLGSGHWTLSLTVLEQNQKPVSDSA